MYAPLKFKEKIDSKCLYIAFVKCRLTKKPHIARNAKKMKNALKTFIAILSASLAAAAAQTEKEDGAVKIGAQSAFKIGNCSVSNGVFKISLPPNAKEKKAVVDFPVNLKKYGGKSLYFEADVKAANVSKPDKKWNGIKFMLHFQHGEKKDKVWNSAKCDTGTFAWKRVSFNSSIPEGAKNATLSIGLQDSTGTVEFKNISYRVFEYEKIPLPENFKAEYSARVKDMPQLRGFMCVPRYDKKHFEDMRALGANLVRFQVSRGFKNIVKDTDIGVYDKWLDGKIAELKTALAKAEELGLNIVVDMHTPPGGRYPEREFRMFHEEKYAKYFIEAWKKIARELKGYKAVWCYNLINEPYQTRPAKFDYLALQYEAAKAIREIDPDVPISIESNMASSAETFSYLSPLPMKDIIYQFHMYHPGMYTHQSVFDREPAKKGIFIDYPVNYNGKKIGKEELSDYMANVVKFQKKYGARIYVGEFSAVRWAPNADLYLADVIDIFEKHGWDWSYHAFREFDGWDIEYADEFGKKEKAKEDTKRKKVLAEALKKNSR